MMHRQSLEMGCNLIKHFLFAKIRIQLPCYHDNGCGYQFHRLCELETIGFMCKLFVLRLKQANEVHLGKLSKGEEEALTSSAEGCFLSQFASFVKGHGCILFDARGQYIHFRVDLMDRG